MKVGVLLDSKIYPKIVAMLFARQSVYDPYKDSKGWAFFQMIVCGDLIFLSQVCSHLDGS